MKNQTTYKVELYLKNEKKFWEHIQRLIQEKERGNVRIEEVMNFNFEWATKGLPTYSI